MPKSQHPDTGNAIVEGPFYDYLSLLTRMIILACVWTGASLGFIRIISETRHH